MNILFLSYHLPTPEQAGAGRPWETAQLLRELGNNVTVITAGTHYMTGEDTRKKRRGLWSSETIGGIKVIKTYATTHHRTSLVRRLLNYFSYTFVSLIAGLKADTKPDVVLTASPPMSVVPVGFLLSRFHRASFMLDERDLYPDTAVALGYLKSKTLIAFLERWQNFFRGKAKSFIAATPGIKKLLEDKGFDEKRIFFFPNAFYQEIAPPDNSWGNGELKKYGWDSKFIILYIGSLGQANYVISTIKSAKIIQNKCEDISFLFMGEGEKKADYIDFCRENGIHNCFFIPAQPRESMPDFIKRADACVHSFKKDDFWKCALPSKVFDYLFSSKPVIFSGSGDIADLIREAEAGIVVKPENPAALAEAVLFLYENPEIREKMGENGRNYVMTHFSREQLARRLAAALSVLDDGQERRVKLISQV